VGVVFIASVLMMSPKGWLWFSIGGAWGSNEYGSKKSIETTLKKVALVTMIVAIILIIVIPFVR